MALLYPQKLTIPQTPNCALEDKLVIINSTYISDTLAYLEEARCLRTVLVVSGSFDSQPDKIQPLISALESRYVGKQIGLSNERHSQDVLDIVRLLNEAKADSAVCIGSRSHADTIKVARLLHQNSPHFGLDDKGLEGLAIHNAQQPNLTLSASAALKLIYIPQSLSVAEYNPVSTITNVNGQAVTFGSLESITTLPDLILLDPEVSLTTSPDHVFLPEGARAIDQACETLCSLSTEEEGLLRARNGLRSLIFGLKAYKDQSTVAKGWVAVSSRPTKRRKQSMDLSQLKLLQAISSCQQGVRDAVTGSICYGSVLGPSHAICRAFSEVTGISVELASSIILPAVLRYENPGMPRGREWRILNQNFILEIINEVMGRSEKTASIAMEKFFKYLGLPVRLSELGVVTQLLSPTVTSADSKHKEEEACKETINAGERDLSHPDILMSVARKVVDEGDWMGGSRQIHDVEIVLNILNSVR